MNWNRIHPAFGWAGLAAGLFLLPRPVQGQQDPAGNPPAAQGFERFDLLYKRNIFDPDRRKFVARVERPPAPPPAPSVNRLVLNGTLIYSKGPVAFFDGTDSSYRQVARINDTLKEFTVVAIDTQKVLLKAGETQFELPVGGELQSQGENPWKLQESTSGKGFSSGATPSRSSSRSTSSNTANPAPAAPAANVSKTEMSDALKRLLEKRKKEMEK